MRVGLYQSPEPVRTPQLGPEPDPGGPEPASSDESSFLFSCNKKKVQTHRTTAHYPAAMDPPEPEPKQQTVSKLSHHVGKCQLAS